MNNYNIIIELCRKCIAFAFATLLQRDLDEFVMHWNSHRIRKSNLAESPSGVPNDLYDMPEIEGMHAWIDALMHASHLVYI